MYRFSFEPIGIVDVVRQVLVSAVLGYSQALEQSVDLRGWCHIVAYRNGPSECLVPQELSSPWGFVKQCVSND